MNLYIILFILIQNFKEYTRDIGDENLCSIME